MMSQTIGLLSQISESALEVPKNKKGCVSCSTDLPGTLPSLIRAAGTLELSSARSAPPIKCSTYKVCRFPNVLQTCVIRWLDIWFSLASKLATCRDGWFWMWDEMWPSLCTCLGINFKWSIRNFEIYNVSSSKGVVKLSLPCEFATSDHPFTKQPADLRKVFRLNYMKDGIWGGQEADLEPANWEKSIYHLVVFFEKVK